MLHELPFNKGIMEVSSFELMTGCARGPQLDRIIGRSMASRLHLNNPLEISEIAERATTRLPGVSLMKC